MHKKEYFWKLLVILLPCCWGSPAGNSLQASLLLGAADSVCPQQSGFLLKLDTLKLLFHFGRYLYKVCWLSQPVAELWLTQTRTGGLE